MDDPYAVDRRGFLKTGAVAAAAAAAACSKSASRWRVLTEDEAATLGAACDRIVPPDEDPGASQAGAVTFIDRQLATRQKQLLPRWQAGVLALDAAALRRHGHRFAELQPPAQDEILQAMQEGSVYMGDWQQVDPQEFFRLLHGHTMMGFYGDPRHGGNRERVAWRMLGVPDPPVRGRLHETPPPPALAPRVSAPQLPERKG